MSFNINIQIEYLKDQFSGDIVWPADAQMECQSTPSSYAVIAVEERSVRMIDVEGQG